MGDSDAKHPARSRVSSRRFAPRGSPRSLIGSIWTSIAAHKTKLSAALGRAFPLRAAAIDWHYLRKESARPIRAIVVARATLREFADVARQALREGDLIGRVGGDEFALMLARIQAAAARGVAARLRTRFEQECGHAGVSFSFGVAALKKGDSAQLALQRADKAMYRQKRARKAKAAKAKKRLA